MLDINDRRELMEFLLTHFNLTELKNLAFAIGVEYEIFPHNTLGDFARELIKYLERIQSLYLLLQEIRRLRPDHNNFVARLLGKVPQKDPIQKVQIILPKDSLKDANDGLIEIAKLLGVNVNEIVLIGATLGTIRLLIGFPSKRLSMQRIIQNQARIRKNISVVSFIAFESLDLLSQQAWQYAALHSPPRFGEGDILPTISWKDAVERARFILSSVDIPSREAFSSGKPNKPEQSPISPPLFSQPQTEKPLPNTFLTLKNEKLSWFQIQIRHKDSLFPNIQDSGWLLVHQIENGHDIKENTLLVIFSKYPNEEASILLKPLAEGSQSSFHLYLARKEMEGPFTRTENQVTLSSAIRHVPVDIEHILGYVVGLWLEIGESGILGS